MIATQKIQKWGNSKGIRIPKKFITSKAWLGATEVDMTVSGDKIILTPTKSVTQLPSDELFTNWWPKINLAVKVFGGYVFEKFGQRHYRQLRN